MKKTTSTKKGTCVKLIAVVMALCLFLTACGMKSKLKGHWVADDVTEVPINVGPYDLILDSDGTGIWDGLSVSWSIKDGVLTLSTIFGMYEFDCEVSGDTMTLDGYSYTKQ